MPSASGLIRFSSFIFPGGIVKETITVTALSSIVFFGLAACGGSGGSQPVSQVQETVIQTSASPPESAIQVLQNDGFPPAVIGIPLPPNATDIAASPLDINDENKPQELVIVYDSPSAANTAATREKEMLASAGYTAVTVSIKDDGYAVVTRASTSDFQKLGL
jgi:hypothetical protein